MSLLKRYKGKGINQGNMMEDEMSDNNATYLFEAKNSQWPPSSESFWTTLFAIFLLEKKPVLTIWRYDNSSIRPYFSKRVSQNKQEPDCLFLDGLIFESVVVEPRALSRNWPGTDEIPTADAGGFSPDVVIRLKNDHFVIIENKITSGAMLNKNQLENYPRLADWLTIKNCKFDILLLMSVGADGLYKQAKELMDKIGGNFGILLWEEVLKKMKESGFAKDYLPIDDWQKYTEALDMDCASS
jgi:hypothetical protein